LGKGGAMSASDREQAEKVMLQEVMRLFGTGNELAYKYGMLIKVVSDACVEREVAILDGELYGDANRVTVEHEHGNDPGLKAR